VYTALKVAVAPSTQPLTLLLLLIVYFHLGSSERSIVMRHCFVPAPALVESTMSESKASDASSLMRKAAELAAQPVPDEVTDLRTALASGGAWAAMRLAMVRAEGEVVGTATVSPASRERVKMDRIVNVEMSDFSR
jgi:hypothetical protein